MRIFRHALFSAIVLLPFQALASDEVRAPRNPGGISMKSVLPLNQSGTGPKVIGGRPAKTEDWPASFYSSAGGFKCTATMIGPRALLLAAHCVGNGMDAAIEFEGRSYSGPCTHALGWQDGFGDESSDYALCWMTTPVEIVKFETVSLDPAKVKVGNVVTLTGYGCTQAPASGRAGAQPTGGNDGVYRIGEAKVAQLPGATPSEPNTILTIDNASICPGDSGGGAYISLSSTNRVLVAVNTRVNFAAKKSFLSSLSTADGRAFLMKWIGDNGDEKVCGINLRGPTCR